MSLRTLKGQQHVDVSVSGMNYPRKAIGYLVNVSYTKGRNSLTETQFLHAPKPPRSPQGRLKLSFDLDFVDLNSITIIPLEPIPDSTVTVCGKQLK